MHNHLIDNTNGSKKMKTVIYEVINGKYQGQCITEQTNASLDSIKLRGAALGWRVVHVYIS